MYRSVSSYASSMNSSNFARSMRPQIARSPGLGAGGSPRLIRRWWGPRHERKRPARHSTCQDQGGDNRFVPPATPDAGREGLDDWPRGRQFWQPLRVIDVRVAIALAFEDGGVAVPLPH